MPKRNDKVKFVIKVDAAEDKENRHRKPLADMNKIHMSAFLLFCLAVLLYESVVRGSARYEVEPDPSGCVGAPVFSQKISLHNLGIGLFESPHNKLIEFFLCKGYHVRPSVKAWCDTHGIRPEDCEVLVELVKKQMGEEENSMCRPDKIPVSKGDGTYSGLVDPNGPWGQHEQDIVIDTLLKGRRGGFFIEIGGWDGEQYSNTLFLEKERGWEGLLVEAIDIMVERIKTKGRSCYYAHACLSRSLSSMNFVEGGVLTVSADVAPSSRITRIDNEMSRGTEFVVDCAPLECFLQQIEEQESKKKGGGEGGGGVPTSEDSTSQSVYYIDFLSLDVEGGEMHILTSIDWDRVYIEVITVEMAEFRTQITQFLLAKGYTCAVQGSLDYVFTRPHLPHMAAAARPSSYIDVSAFLNRL